MPLYNEFIQCLLFMRMDSYSNPLNTADLLEYAIPKETFTLALWPELFLYSFSDIEDEKSQNHNIWKTIVHKTLETLNNLFHRSIVHTVFFRQGYI